MRHGVARNGPCVRCMESGEDVISGETADKRSVRVTKMIGSCFLEIPRNNTGIVGDGNELV